MLFQDTEFNQIIEPIIENSKFRELSNYRHHGITRFEHCLRVSYMTYKITKKLNLNYVAATEAALLHDFFTDEVENYNSVKKLTKHPEIALENAKKYFHLTTMQEDIILKHMFPFSFRIPKYLESWIVDFCDDISAVFERGHSVKHEFSTTTVLIFSLIINYFKIR